jgi:signal transduction histidine kinase
MIQVSAAKGKEFKKIKNSFELVKEYDVKLLNAILHNIKAPAGIISARLDIAKLSKDQKLSIDAINTSVEIMNSQVRQIDAFTEVINSQKEISLKEVSLRLKKLTLNRVSPNILGNENHTINESIFVALESVLSNAMNYSRLTKVDITEASGAVSITIKDKGPGIAPEIFEKLGFELIEKPESFGISLLLGRFILKRSQWFIEIGSKFNEGSCFTISNRPIENRSMTGEFDLYKNV